MILNIKVTSIDNHIDTGEEVVKISNIDFIVKDSLIEGIWVESDFDEMYVYVHGERVTANYDAVLHKKICALLGHPEYNKDKTDDHGIS